MSGLEMMARNGRLVYVRPTGRIDERDEAMDTRETPPGDKALLDRLDKLDDRCGYGAGLPGYWCSRVKGHDGPCAAHPVGIHGKDPVPEEDQPFNGGCFKGVLFAVGMFLAVLALFWWWMLKG